MLISQEDIVTAAGLDRRGLRWLAQHLMRWLRIPEVNALYAKHRDKNGIDFLDAALAELGVDYDLPMEQWDHIPTDRPFILVANHPLGAIDGLLLMRIVAEKRQDFKIMGTFLLERVEPIRQWVIRVNQINAIRNAHGNISGMRETVQQLSAGRPLLVFPAGTVSTLHLRSGKIEDRAWEPAIAKWIRKYRCAVVPLHISGANGPVFQSLARIHRVVKLALQIPVAFSQAGNTISVRIGEPITPAEWSKYTDDRSLSAYLRSRTYQLREQ